mgnify:FL=1|tara:strand:+ start:2136 stop:3113 length:978 start_codon:yes stop_codon:yes gene_type:complete
MALTKVSTPAIKDEAITLAKLLHGDSNNNGKFLRANNGADPSFESIPAGTTINSNADNRLITGDANSNTLNGESNFTFNGTVASITGGLKIDGSGINDASSQDSALYVTTDVNDWGAIFQKTTEYGVKIDSPNTATLAFALYNGVNQKLAIAGDGKITAQNNLAFASGKGIDFSATSHASGMTSELLSDYEEGTWTPDFQKNGVSNPTPSQYLKGNYTRVGNLLFLSAYYYMGSGSNSAGSNGYWTVTGLPFSVEDSLQGAYQYINAGYMLINSTDYITNSSYNYNIRWQANSPTTLNMYGPISGMAWSSGAMEIAFAGVLKIHD